MYVCATYHMNLQVYNGRWLVLLKQPDLGALRHGRALRVHHGLSFTTSVNGVELYERHTNSLRSEL